MTRILPPSYRPIPLYPNPPFSSPNNQKRNDSELSDGFPPIKIFKTPPPAPSSTLTRLQPLKMGLGELAVMEILIIPQLIFCQ